MLYTHGNKFYEPGPSMRDQIKNAVIGGSPGAGLTFWNALSAIPAEKWLTYIIIGYTLCQAYVFIRDHIVKRKPQ